MIVTALFCDEKLYLTRFLISSTDGTSLPPNAGSGLLTFNEDLTALFFATSEPLTEILMIPVLLIMPWPIFVSAPPPTLYLTHNVVFGLNVIPKDRLFIKSPI